MDRRSLGVYGGVTIVVIILIIMMSLTTPVGRGFIASLYDNTDEITRQGEIAGVGDPLEFHTIQIETGYQDAISSDKGTAKLDQDVSVIAQNEEERKLTGLVLFYDGRSKTVEGTSFKMINSDVIVRPIWSEYEFTEVYFSDPNEAGLVANAVGDKAYNSRPKVTFNGQPCSVVYDYSTMLGANFETYANRQSIKKVIVGSNCTEIAKNAFFNDSNLEIVRLSNKTKTIQANAFYNCSSLHVLNLEDGIDTIDTNAFYNCTALGSDRNVGPKSVLTIPQSVRTIGPGAFSHTSFTHIDFRGPISAIEDYAFYGCNQLVEAYIPDSVLRLGENAFPPAFMPQD